MLATLQNLATGSSAGNITELIPAVSRYFKFQRIYSNTKRNSGAALKLLSFSKCCVSEEVCEPLHDTNLICISWESSYSTINTVPLHCT
jgi:hypothetical protein